MVEPVTARLAEKGERYPKRNGESPLTFASYTQWVISYHFCGEDIQKPSGFVTTHRDSEKE